jgi:hypothetical protein
MVLQDVKVDNANMPNSKERRTAPTPLTMVHVHADAAHDAPAAALSRLEHCLSPKNKNQAKLPKSLSPKMELRLRLLPKIAEMRLKKLITSEEESEYLKILTTKQGGGGGCDGDNNENNATEQVCRRLKDIERKHKHKQSQSAGGAAAALHASSSSNKRPKPKRALSKNNLFVIRPEPEHQTKKVIQSQHAREKETRTRTRTNTIPIPVKHGPLVLNPSSCKQLNLSETDLQDLFVEMCFYARFRFLQPPCCLYCTHKRAKPQTQQQQQQPPKKPGDGTDSIDSTSPLHNTKEEECHPCRRLVLWREDATKILSKNTLAGNLLLIRCKDAQALLQGNTISVPTAQTHTHWWWDADKRRILAHLL